MLQGNLADYLLGMKFYIQGTSDLLDDDEKYWREKVELVSKMQRKDDLQAKAEILHRQAKIIKRKKLCKKLSVVTKTCCHSCPSTETIKGFITSERFKYAFGLFLMAYIRWVMFGEVHIPLVTDLKNL